jgi:hypothetical protein
MLILKIVFSKKEWVYPDNTPKSISNSLEYNGNVQLIRKSYIRQSVNTTEFVEFLYGNDRIVRATGYYNNLLPQSLLRIPNSHSL